MRRLAVWLSVALLSSSVLAANRTERIRLIHVRVEDVERLLNSPRRPDAPPARSGEWNRSDYELHPLLGSGHELSEKGWNLMPEGIAAWTSDTHTNSLVATGDGQSLEQLKRIVRFFDIPARRFEISVRVPRLGPATRLEVHKLGQPLREGMTWSRISEPDLRKKIESGPFRSQATLVTPRALWVRVPSGSASYVLPIVPRPTGRLETEVVLPSLGASDKGTPVSVLMNPTEAVVLEGGPFSDPVYITARTLPDPVE